MWKKLSWGYLSLRPSVGCSGRRAQLKVRSVTSTWWTGHSPYWHTRVKSVVAPTARAGLVRPSLSLQVLRTRRELPPLHLGRVVPNKKGGGMETLDGLLLRPGHSSPARPKKGGQQLHCLQLSLYDISGLHVKGKYVGCHLTIPL